MSAKEERSHNLEIHKMSRMNNEFIQKNSILEAECMRLRVAIRQESEKHAAKHNAMMQQFNATIELERAKMNALQCHFEKERERLTEEARKDAVSQRAAHIDALGDIKRQLDIRYNEKLNENKIALDAAIRQLDEERERVKRDERAQLAQLNEEREQIKQQLNEDRERIKRDEREQLVQFLFHMDSEREKNKCQLEKERLIMMERVHNETVAQHQSTADMLAEMKISLDAKHNAKMKELDIAMQELNEEREQLQKTVQERQVQLNEEREQLQKTVKERQVQLNEEREQLQQTEKERQVQLDEEREQLHKTVHERQVQLDEEREQLHKTVHERQVQLDEEREQLQQTVKERLVQLNEEREQLQQTVKERQVQLNEEREQLQQTVKERQVQLNEEREQLQQTVKERLVQLNEEREQIKLERVQMDLEIQCRLEKERSIMMEQAHENDVAHRKFNEDLLAEMKMQLDAKCNAHMNALMNEHRIAFEKLDEEREQINQQLHEEREQINQQLHKEREQLNQQLMRDDLEREKLHALQLQLEKERSQARKDDAAQRQSNADALAEMKRQMDAQYNEQMNKNKLELDAEIQKINEEYARIKHDDLEREKMKCQLENNRAEQARKDDAAQRQSNADALAETKRQMDVKFNEQMKTNKIAFDTAMHQLNEERVQIKRMLNEERDRNRRDDLEREKIHAFQIRLEKEREQLFEQAKKDMISQRQSNMDAIAETKRQLDSQLNVQMNKNKIAHDASLQKLNEERDQLKQHEHAMNETFRKKMQTLQSHFEKEHETLAEQARKEDMAQKQCNADALKEMKKHLDAQCNDQLNKNKMAYDDAMQKLNEEHDQLKQHEHAMNESFRKKMQTLQSHFEKERETLAEQLNEHRRQMELDRTKIHALYDALEKERELLTENASVIAENKRHYDIAMQQLNEERDTIKRNEQQQLIHNSSLMDEINQLKTQLKEDREKYEQSHSDLKRRFNIEKSEIEHMHNAIDSNYAHMQLIHTLNFTGKRVMLYSHYSDKNEVESYNLLAIECIQHYFDYIVILTNCPNKWNMHSPNYNKCHLLTYNMKSDFRNYGVFIMQTSKILVNASRLCLINDSFVIVDVSVFGCCMKRLFDRDDLSHDFLGLTSSHENVFHVQSYFMCFNSTTLPTIITYFEKHGLPTNHQTAISQYELGLTSHLIDKGFSSFAVVSNDDMRHPLNTTCCKWSAVLEEIGIIKRQHFFKRYAYAAMTDSNIALVAENYSYNKHLINFLKYNGIHVKTVQ